MKFDQFQGSNILVRPRALDHPIPIDPPKKVVRDFTRCPRCKAATIQSTNMNGTSSEFWRECTQCNTYINTYIPQEHQEGVHTDHHKFVGNFGGYGTGKTTTSRQEFYKHMFLTKNGTTLIGSKVITQYEQTIKRDIENDLPKNFVSHVNVQKAYVEFINGHRVVYRPLDDQGKLRSLNLSMFIIVEASEVDAEIYSQLKTRLRNVAATIQLVIDGVPQFRRTKKGVEVPIIQYSWLKGIVESNPDSGWIRSQVLLVSDYIYKHGHIADTYAVLEDQRDPATSSHVAATDVNEFLVPDPQTFIRDNCKNKPGWWVARYINGSFSYAEGLVYPSAMGCVVPTFDIPKEWKRIVAFDYGLSDDARFVFVAIDQIKGVAFVYKELSTNNRSVEELAALYFKGIADIPSGGMLFAPIIDPKSGPKRDYMKKSLSDHFLELGISFQSGQIPIDARVFRLNTYFESGYLKVMDNCTVLITELREYKFPSRKLGDNKNADKPVDKNNHSINPLEWIVMELPANPKNILYGVYTRLGTLEGAEEHKLTRVWQLSDPEEDYDYCSTSDTPLFGDNAFGY